MRAPVTEVKFLDQEAVAAALPYDRLIDGLDDAFRTAVNVPKRMHEKVPVPGGAAGTLLIMPAWEPGGSLGVKIATVYPENARHSLPSVLASYLLLDATTGEPRALLDGAELTARRTAAASALASRYLSRPDAATLLIVGTGTLAPHLVSAHAAVRPLRRVIAWGRRREAAAALREHLPRLGVDFEVADDLAGAVGQADIVSCATLATSPLIRGAWLRAGQHLDLVGAFRPDMAEADAQAIRRAAVYVDTRAGAMSEAGEIVQALTSGDLLAADIRGDLFDLARGTVPGRQSPRQVTLFKSVGTALEDLAAAELAVAAWRG